MSSERETETACGPAVDAGTGPAALLRSAGLRATAPRQSILAWLERHPHATAESVGSGIRAEAGSVSRQTVYNVLWSLVDAGLVRAIQPAGHAAHFERRVGDNHHHLVCRRCGRTEDADCAVGAAPCLGPPDRLDFVVDEAEVVFWGTCPSCTNGPDAGLHIENKERERSDD